MHFPTALSEYTQTHSWSARQHLVAFTFLHLQATSIIADPLLTPLPPKGVFKSFLGSLSLSFSLCVAKNFRSMQHAGCMYFRSVALLPQLNAPHYCAAHTRKHPHTHTHMCIINTHITFRILRHFLWYICSACGVATWTNARETALQQQQQQLHKQNAQANTHLHTHRCKRYVLVL